MSNTVNYNRAETNEVQLFRYGAQFFKDVQAAKERLIERAEKQFGTNDMYRLAYDLRDLANDHVGYDDSEVAKRMLSAADRLQNFDENNYDKGGEDLRSIISDLYAAWDGASNPELQDYLHRLAGELQEDGNFYHTGPQEDPAFLAFQGHLLELKTQYEKALEDTFINVDDRGHIGGALAHIAEYLPEDDSEVKQNLMRAATLLKDTPDGDYGQLTHTAMLDLLSLAMARTQGPLHDALRDMKTKLPAEGGEFVYV